MIKKDYVQYDEEAMRLLEKDGFHYIQLVYALIQNKIQNKKLISVGDQISRLNPNSFSNAILTPIEWDDSVDVTEEENRNVTMREIIANAI